VASEEPSAHSAADVGGTFTKPLLERNGESSADRNRIAEQDAITSIA
jgi:hypothetical protein